MRKFIIVMVAALAFVACEKNYQMEEEQNELANVVKDNKVSLKQALIYAERSIDAINPTTRSKEREIKSAEIYVAKPATRSVENLEVSFYLINYENNEGFALVSTDRRTTPVYAYSNEGNLTINDIETNPGLRIFMDGTIENYQIEVANNIYEPIEQPDSSYRDILRLPIVEYDGGLYYEDNTSEIVIKENLLTTYWKQDSPYGDNCPNGIGGCGPVAAAQIMAYHKYPSQRLWHTYDWDSMTISPILNVGDEGAVEASQLIHQIGEEADAVYANGHTSTNIGNMRTAFLNFSYSCGSPASYDITRIKENINAMRPIYIRGEDSEGGHAWVIDGYHSQTFRTTYYYTYAPYDMYETFVVSSRVYLHCNLGWGYSSAQITNNGYYYNGSFLHNNNLRVIYDIMPNE